MQTPTSPPPARESHAAGVVCLLAGVALFSTVEIAGKTIGARVDPVVLTFVRFFLTGLVLLGLSVPMRAAAPRLGPRDYAVFCLNGLVGITIGISLFHIAILAFEKASSAAVVFCVNPLFAMIFGRFINGEPWSGRKWVAVSLGVVGVSLFSLETGGLTGQSLVGLGLMLLSAAFFALSVCIAKRVMARYGAMLLMAWSALFGSLLMLPWVAFRMARHGAGGLAEAWVPVLYIVLAGTTLAYLLYYMGLSRTSVHAGSMAFFLKPVLASGMAVALLGERINVYMACGTALVLVGLIVLVVRPRRGAASREGVLVE